MITPTQANNANSTAASVSDRRTVSKNSSTFTEVFRSSTAEQSRRSAAPAKAAAATSNTGAAAAASSTLPASPAVVSSALPAASAAASSALPASPAGLPYAFTPQAIENHMNQWLMGVLQRQNEVRMQIYNNAVEGWQNVNARNRELGLPEIPAPPPPELAEVAPMPAGWWFQTHS